MNAGYSYTLLANFEQLELTGVSNLRGMGNELNNRINGNDGANILRGMAGNDTLVAGLGNDTLDGGEGDDVLQGGLGDDIYRIGLGTDRVSELSASGTDRVESSASYALLSNVENLTLTGTGAINGYGNTLDNIIRGNAAANHLKGNDGNDRLEGGSGDDILEGGGGNDILNGSYGGDRFIFDAGQDTVQGFSDNADILVFNDALWGFYQKTNAEIVDYARVVNGNAVFTFAEGVTLTVLGVTNLQILLDDVAYI